MLLSALYSCKKDVYREKEPNNSFTSANKIEPDIAVEGLLDTGSDHDFYRLDIVSPIVMDIELSPVKGINHAIRIWRERSVEPLEIKYIDDSRKSSPERMRNMYFYAGAYYIEILHGDRDIPQGNPENNYVLHLRSGSWDGEEKEPNDDDVNANLLEIGREVKGYFSPAFNKLNTNTASLSREEDWYYFDVDLADGKPVLLDITISGVPDVSSMLSLFDGDKNEIASSGAGNTGEAKRLEGIGIMKPGRYYIMAASNFESNNGAMYTLQTTAKAYDYSTEIEPNNNFESANPMQKPGITGKIFSEGDRDYYLYTAPAADAEGKAVADEQYLYRIDASSDSLDLIVRIFDENRKKLFEIDNVKGPGAEIMPDALLKMAFYIEVSSRRGDNTSPDYNLNVSFIPYNESFEIEPNDTKEKATRIKGSRITGFISRKDDRDYYLIEYKTRVRKKFTFNGIKNAEFKISVTDPMGFVVKTEQVKDGESVSFKEMIDLKGYIIIESVSGNYDDPYTIELGE
ncbi:MAG: hypothetical protein V1874_00755 [Spirochaetota bacterium]